MTDPGLALDPRALRAMLNGSKSRKKDAEDMVRRHIAAHRGFVAFSGGKDSAVAAHLALCIDPSIPLCFYDSGLEFPETMDYIQTFAEHYDATLTIIPTRITTLDYLRNSAAFDHRREPRGGDESLHYIKITEPSEKARRMYGEGLIWGLRADESFGRRNLLVPRRGVVEGVHTVSCAPLWNWSADEVFSYLESESVPQNPVYDKLRSLGVPAEGLRVGGVLDGGNLDYGRITWLKRGWPELYERLVNALPRLAEYR